MKYLVSEMYINCNGLIHWEGVAVVSGKKAAVAEADSRTVRASVVPHNAGGPVVYDNSKPHGGEANFHERCSCPKCRA